MNPVCGVFAIDAASGQLDFLAHTEVMRYAARGRNGCRRGGGGTREEEEGTRVEVRHTQ